MGASEKDSSTGPSEDVRRLPDEQRGELEEISKRLDELWRLSGTWSPEARDETESSEAAQSDESRCAARDPRADDCPAYAELAERIVAIQRSMRRRDTEIDVQLAYLDERLTTEEAEGHVVAEMLKKAAAVEPSIEEAMIAADKRLEELDNDVSGLEDRLRSCDAQQHGYYRRTAHRLEALERAKPATFDGLSDVLARLDALESRAGGEGGEAHVLRAVTFRELADLDSRVERLEMATTRLATLEVNEPPRAAAAERRILRLARQAERLPPGEDLELENGIFVEKMLLGGWRLLRPTGQSRHSEAADAVLYWLNRRTAR